MREEKNYGLIDLHLHLDGSLSVATVRQLAAMAGKALPEEEQLLEMLQVSPGCKDLNEYLEKFSFPCSLLQTGEAIETAVYNLMEELKDQGLLYAEIRFAPQLHTLEGLSQMEVVRAAVEGRNRSEFKANLILCCMRGDRNRQENLQTVEAAAEFLGRGVCALDLAGAEALYPTEAFGELFRLANEKGIPLTIHAGEAAGPESVWAALEYHPRRIGHGVRSLEDGKLTERLGKDGITLELCPTSNLNTNIFPRLEDYPLRRLLEAGVPVTINTDNMTVSDVTLRSELEQVIRTFALTDGEIGTLLRSSVDASFADEQTKNRIRREIDCLTGRDPL